MNNEIPGIHAFCCRSKMTLIGLTVEWIASCNAEWDCTIFDETFGKNNDGSRHCKPHLFANGFCLSFQKGSLHSDY